MLFYVVRSQTHRLISTSFVLKHAEGRALAVASIKPIVTHKTLRTLNDWHKFLAYPAVDLCTVLWIEVIMTNNGEHDAAPSFNAPSLRNQKKLSCVWIFHDGPGRKIGNIDILSLIRCIRTRDHPFPARHRNSIGQTS